jgi:hypothetical protein
MNIIGLFDDVVKNKIIGLKIARYVNHLIQIE